MNFVKQIMTENTVDAFNHLQFIRYGKGVFEGRAYYKIKNGAKLQMWCGFEFVPDILRCIIYTNDEIQVTGKIYAKEPMQETYLANEEKKKGFYIYTLNDHFTKEQAQNFYETCKGTYILAKITAKYAQLTVNAKPHNPRGSYKEKFCSLKAEGKTKEAILEEFVGDQKGIKEIEARHTFNITHIEVPSTLEKDPAKARILAKRVGIMERLLLCDGQESKTSHPFTG